MNPLEQNARQLIDHLQAVQAEAERADARNESLREKLSKQEIRVLDTVGRERCCIMSRVAAAIRLSLSSATGLVDRLCEKKLLRRDRSSEDRRVVEVELTEEGRALREAALEGRVGLVRDGLQALSAEEQTTLVALLGKLSAGVKANGPG
jgi:DNA-binding MarR family transcriptional regulator